jgi:hypothetical protein
MRWLLTPTAENSWRFVMTVMICGLVFHVVAFAATTI